MKYQKFVDKDNGKDTYVISINHDEADRAFSKMSEDEKRMLIKSQAPSRVSQLLKALTLWSLRIEEGYEG